MKKPTRRGNIRSVLVRAAQKETTMKPSKYFPPIEKKPLLHRRGSGSFGFSALPICGEKGDKVKMTSNPKWVTCPKCRERIDAQRAAAKERTT